MATKKSVPKKTAKKTFIQKLGETASHLKEEIVAGKDHLTEVAGDAIESIKTSIQNITHKKKAVKKAKKVSVKKIAKNTTAKKSAPKKVIKKALKKVAKKK